MNPDDAQLIESIADAFSQSAPDGWTQIRVEAPSITEVTGFTAKAMLPSGDSQSFYIDDDAREEDVIDKIEELRRTMAGRNGDRGAWFTMSLDITGDGRYSAQFDYDGKPKFDFEVSRESLLKDLEEFPRSEEFYPEWLQ